MMTTAESLDQGTQQAPLLPADRLDDRLDRLDDLGEEED
jgi:hypothetical protein